MTANIKLAFAKQPDDLFEVRHFSIRESLNDLFDVTVVATSQNEDIDFDTLLGNGVALVLDGVVQRAWAGIVSEVTQVHGELASEKKVAGAESASTYRIVIVPTLWRTTLRRNSRIYQHKTTPTIVKELLAEWKIEPDVSLLRAQYKPHEYCVQYQETDFAFLSRLLEDAGITYYFSHEKTSGKGEVVTKLILNDAPQKNPQRTDPLALVAAHDLRWGVATYACADVTFSQRARPGTFIIRDFDFRQVLTKPLMAQATIGKNDPGEEKLEQFEYHPGAFWWEEQKGGDTPHADDHGIARTDPKESDAKIPNEKDETNVLVNRTLEAERRRRLLVTFMTNAIDVNPGIILAINQKSPQTDDHPRKELAHDKKLLVTETHFEGYSFGDWTLRSTAVFADFTYRPEKSTPRPKVFGAQSAIVVGPKGQEIWTDEFGRVRVQFHWDREGKYDDASSCWLRVSQPWAGHGYGAIAIPRVGHEVLVDFFEGDPDLPVILGRLYNNTSYGGALAPGIPYKGPDHQTKTGWKSDSSQGGAGFNELVFEDAKGNELIHFQAQKDLSYTIKADEGSSIGGARSAAVGESDSTSVTGGRGVRVKKAYTVGVGQSYTVSVGKKTSISISDQTIAMSTGDASVTLYKEHILFDAKEAIHLHAGNGVEVTVENGAIFFQGGPLVRINDGSAGPAPVIDKPVPAADVGGPGAGGTSGGPYKPSGGLSIDPPGPPDAIKVESPKPLTPAATFKDDATFKPLQGSLFGDKGPTPNDLHQGQIGDCYLLSSMQSIAKQHPEMLQSMVKEQMDGTYLVTMHDPPTRVVDAAGNVSWTPGGTHDVVVKPDAADYAARDSQSGNWARVVEKAYAQENGAGNGYQGIGGGAYPSDAMARLTGQPGQEYGNAPGNFAWYKDRMDKGDVMVGWTDPAGATGPVDPDIYPSHAYSVQRMYTDPTTGQDMVDLYNPHNSFIPAEAGRPQTGSPKGSDFTMTYADFQKNFPHMSVGSTGSP